MPPILGVIADDFTGATDLAGVLAEKGLRTVVMIGAPRVAAPAGNDAIVVALKTRTAPADEAVRLSLRALDWLRTAGCRRYFFKYCSTFDSTDKGNIGPVAEALLHALGEDFTIACPAFPANGRAVFHGYLHVGDGLLNESGMKDHPLTPMTDSDLVRVLGRQTRGRVGLVAHQAVRQGAEQIEASFRRCRREEIEIAIVDATSDEDLTQIGEAARGLTLSTGASGLAMGLAHAFRATGELPETVSAPEGPSIEGPAAVLCGSCSTCTRGQVERMKAWAQALAIDPLQLAQSSDAAGEVLAWASEHLEQGPVLIYSRSDAAGVALAQERLGKMRAAKLVEDTLAAVSVGLVERGVTRLIVAGGETSGAVVAALGLEGLSIGREIDPGVPWTRSLGTRPLALALKSGNFGGPDFFRKALRQNP